MTEPGLVSTVVLHSWRTCDTSAVLNLCAFLVGRETDGMAVDDGLVEAAMIALSEDVL